LVLEVQLLESIRREITAATAISTVLLVSGVAEVVALGLAMARPTALQAVAVEISTMALEVAA
jgi:hypothetical protein